MTIVASWSPAWRRAVYLAQECRLDWARWALGLTAARPFWPGKSESDRWTRDPIMPVPDPSDVAAYLADCERRGVAPVPVPSLEGCSEHAVDAWRVDADGYTWISVAHHSLDIDQDGTAHGDLCCSSADFAQLAALVAAVERADRDGAG